MNESMNEWLELQQQEVFSSPCFSGTVAPHALPSFGHVFPEYTLYFLRISTVGQILFWRTQKGASVTDVHMSPHTSVSWV